VPRANLACGRVGDDGDGYAAEQTRIKAHVEANCSRRPPAGVFAWHGESVPHASWWRRPRLEVAPRVVAHASVEVGGSPRETETSSASRRLVARGGDSLEGVPLVGTGQRSSQLVGNRMSCQ
jgi:hypothetical protein